MEEYKYDEESVNALVNWAETATFPEQVMLSDAENIFDAQRLGCPFLRVSHAGCKQTAYGIRYRSYI